MNRCVPAYTASSTASASIRGSRWAVALRRRSPPSIIAGRSMRSLHGSSVTSTMPGRLASAIASSTAAGSTTARCAWTTPSWPCWYSLVPLAPLHQPQELAAIRAVAERWSDVPQFVCFDTAFHRGRPEIAQMFALPMSLYESGIRRYGFHGISYEAIAEMLPDVAPEIADGRVVVAHLGNGASLCAMRARRSVDTTMSFSALDGLPMGTRVGDLDPAGLLYPERAGGMTAAAVQALF